MEIRMPNITASTAQGQIEQIRSFLYQFTGELQHALDYSEKRIVQMEQLTIGDAGAENGNVSVAEEQKAIDSFNEIKGLIIKSADIVAAYYEKFMTQFNGEYFADSDFSSYLAKTNATIFASDSELKTVVAKTETIDGEITALKESNTTISQTAEGLKVSVTGLLENGINKVRTGKDFTFDDNGLTVGDPNNLLTTQVTEDGMKVKYNGSDMLKANSHGVEAKNLDASTHLIIGKKIRFETLPSGDRVGCFWVG